MPLGPEPSCCESSLNLPIGNASDSSLLAAIFEMEETLRADCLSLSGRISSSPAPAAILLLIMCSRSRWWLLARPNPSRRSWRRITRDSGTLARTTYVTCCPPPQHLVASNGYSHLSLRSRSLLERHQMYGGGFFGGLSPCGCVSH